MALDLASLNVKIGGDSSGAVQAFRTAQESLQRFTKVTEQAQAELSDLDDLWSVSAADAAKMAAANQKVADSVNHYADAMKGLDDVADEAGKAQETYAKKIDAVGVKAEETGGVIRRAMMRQMTGEIMGTSLRNAVEHLDGMAKAAGNAAASIAQGFFQAGPVGAALAATGQAINFVVEGFGSMGKAAREAAAEAAAAAAAATGVAMASYGAADKRLAAATKEIDAIRRSKATGLSVGEVKTSMALQDVDPQIRTMRAEIETKQRQLDAALHKRTALGGVDVLERHGGTVETGVQERLIAPINETIETLRRSLTALKLSLATLDLERKALLAEQRLADMTTSTGPKAGPAQDARSKFGLSGKLSEKDWAQLAGGDLDPGKMWEQTQQGWAEQAGDVSRDAESMFHSLDLMFTTLDEAARKAGEHVEQWGKEWIDKETKQEEKEIQRDIDLVVASVDAATGSWMDGMKKGIKILGLNLLTGFGKVAPVMQDIASAAVQGAKAGGPWGAVGAAGAALLSHSKGGKSVGKEVESQVLADANVFGEAIAGLATVLRTLHKVADPLTKAFGALLKVALSPAWWLLEKAIAAVGWALSWVAEAFLRMAKVVADIFGGSDKIDAAIVAMQRYRASVWKNTAAQDENTEKIREVSEALTNVPAGFKVALARFHAQDAGSGARSLTDLYLPGHADGGIFTRPHVARIAERGPEAVIPLTGAGAGALVRSTVYIGTVNVKSPTGDGFLAEIQHIAERQASAAWGSIAQAGPAKIFA